MPHNLIVKNPKTKIGEKYGRWTILGAEFYIKNLKHKKPHRRQHVIVECQCGFIIAYPVQDIVTGKSKGCINCRIKRLSLRTGKKHFAWSGYKSIPGSVWCRIKANAKQRDLNLNVSISDIHELYEKQKGKCALSNLPINFGVAYKDCTASLDRIDSSRGYFIDNIQWLHENLNIMKWIFSQQEFINICCLIANKKSFSLPKIPITTHKRSIQFEGIGNISGKYFRQLNRSAKRRNLFFKVDLEYLWNLYLSQNSRCYYSSVPMFFPLPGDENSKASLTNASLDRINSDLGYIKDNLCWVEKRIQKIKLNFSEKRFLGVRKLVSKLHNPDKNYTDILEQQERYFAGPCNSIGQQQRGPKTGKYKGVSWSQRDNRFRARIVIQGQVLIVGYFNNEREAAMNYDYYVLQGYNKGAYLNFPDHDYSNFIPKRKLPIIYNINSHPPQIIPSGKNIHSAA